LMFQEYALFPHRNVRGNVEFGLRVGGADAATRARRVDEVLELVGLRELRDRSVANLSGGEQQRVALARALAVEPRLLLLDEPLGALDRAWRTRLLDEIRQVLERSSLPAIYVTHDHDEAFTIADRIAVMRSGRIVQQGRPADVWRRPADVWTARFFGFEPVVRAVAGDGAIVTPWGALPAPSSSSARAGTVDLVLRPDAARLDLDGPIAATVVQARLRIDGVVLTLAIDDAPPLTVRVSHVDSPAVGTRVRASVDPDAVLTYPVRAD
jgi:thiamine transport system ATP-binding protein